MKSIKHVDDRRTLIEWISDASVRSCKAVIAKGETMVGEHFHNNKDEYFCLISGKGESSFHPSSAYKIMKIGEVFAVPRGLWHAFKLSDGAILLGAASEPYDPKDEHRV